METLKVGVVGLGVIGREHVHSFRSVPGVEVAGGYDADRSTCERTARDVGIRAFGSLEELIGDATIRAVSVCTPEALHLGASSAAIEAGKHVLIEKPLASSYDDGGALLKLALASHKVVMVGQTLRFVPHFAAARKLLGDGAIGNVSHLSTRRSNSITNAIRTAGRTSVSMFLGVHDLDFCMWALGSRVSRVCALGAYGVLRPKYGINVADTVLGAVEFESGAVAGVEFSWCLPLEGVDVLDAHFEALGDRGQLLLGCRPDSLRLVSRDLQRVTEVDVADVTGLAPDSSGLDLEIAGFVEAVRAGSAPPVGVREGYEAMVAALALDESCEGGCSVTPSYGVGERA